MKLDYLQFLDLEVFTRFGAHLEASMEAAIRRGRLLREILKQERFSPLPAAFELAWMIAFNDGLLDAVDPERIPGLMGALEGSVRSSGLGLDSPRQEWKGAVEGWLSDALAAARP